MYQITVDVPELTPALIAKISATIAMHRLLDTITKHSDYVGEDGKAATSKGGFAIQINSKIKQLFGKPIDELVTEKDIIVLRNIRDAVAWKIQECEDNKINRSEIKKHVYSTIDAVYKIYY